MSGMSGCDSVWLLCLLLLFCRWGYNPRQLLALHRALGSPEVNSMLMQAAHVTQKMWFVCCCAQYLC
jgi:hypothetical protein